MADANRHSSLLTRMYAWAQATGILDHDLAYRAFVRSYFLYKRYVEDPFAGLAKRYPALFRSGHVLDVGANVGYTASVFRDAADPEFLVIGFEPDAQNLRGLRATIRRHSLGERIVAVHAAVGDRNGETAFWHNRRHSGDHRVVTPAFAARLAATDEVAQVPMVSIDSYLHAHRMEAPIAFVKIDVQGFELPVCRGMTQTLDRNPRAAVAVEYAPEAARALGFDAVGVDAFFRERGFSVYTIAPDGRLAPFEPAHHLAPDDDDSYADLLCTRQAV